MLLTVEKYGETKLFAWENPTRILRLKACLVTDGLTLGASIKVIRRGVQISFGHVTEPRGEHFFFSGLETIVPKDGRFGQYFFQLAAAHFKSRDEIEIDFSAGESGPSPDEVRNLEEDFWVGSVSVPR